MTARTLAAAAFIAVIGTALAQPPKPLLPTSAPVPQPVKAEPKAEKPDLAKQLSARVTVQKLDAKFKDAVKLFAEAYDLPLVLTPAAENATYDRDEGESKRGDQVVKLSKLTDVKLATALALLCEQADARFLIYPDHIRIVPHLHAAYETGVLTEFADPNTTQEPPLLSATDLVRSRPLTKRGLVSASFKNKPLVEVIDEISELTGANVAVSPLLPANVRQSPITVRFANIPVDAAVRTLCEMTECGVIEDANVLLITTRERATARAKEEAQKAKDRQPPQQQFFGGGNPFPVNPLPDVNAELLKLKDQNEQLKKELEEIKKLLKK